MAKPPNDGNGQGRDVGPLREYSEGAAFNGLVGRTAAESRPAWPAPPEAPQDAPNVLMIVLDDTGFGQLGCYGGLGDRIETPYIDALASRGLRFNNFHTTALCSPTRACLLTGRNHHSVGVGTIMEAATGYPGYNGRIPREAAMLPTILAERGWNTMCLGKWHLAPDEHNSAAGPYDRWPLGQGFERFYGFLPGETDQWHPDLWHDNHRVSPPAGPEAGYHLSADLVDHAIDFINEQKAVTPDKPFFMYLAFGAHHSPHHAPRAYIDRYRGRFDVGWDVVREETLARQKQLGIVPGNTELPPPNPGVKAWADLEERERRVFARQMETFAGFMTHTDDQIGRLLDFLGRVGQLDDTLILLVSDNGASGEGGPIGLSSEVSFFNMTPETIEQLEEKLDRWGGPGTHPHYATGWAMAGNTPQRWYKQSTFEGGTRDPLIVSWPARLVDHGAIRDQFHHCTDLMPTILELVGLEMPTVVRGWPQKPLEGVSLAYAMFDSAAPTRKTVQYFEMLGHRAIWQDGWKAVTFHRSTASAQGFGLAPPARDLDFEADRWELFHLDRDFSEVHDLAQQEPERLRALVEAWWAEAGKYNVLPLDDTLSERIALPKPTVVQARTRYTFVAPVKLVRSASPDVRGRSFAITAELLLPPDGAEGVIASNGGPDGGFTLFVADRRLTYVSNFVGREHTVIRAEAPLPAGHVNVRFEFHREGAPGAGTGVLFVDGREVAREEIARTNLVAYAAAEGLEIGSDSTAPVWPGYTSPFPFTGRLRQVNLDVGLDSLTEFEPDRPEARRARAEGANLALMRQ